jgi:hypothetical protein
MRAPKPNMGHSIVQYQGARKRETVSLSLRFLQDYVVFDFEVTSFLTRDRGRKNKRQRQQDIKTDLCLPCSQMLVPPHGTPVLLHTRHVSIKGPGTPPQKRQGQQDIKTDLSTLCSQMPVPPHCLQALLHTGYVSIKGTGTQKKRGSGKPGHQG